MWSFAWILGLVLVFGILNAMWYEISERDSQHDFQSEQ